jgi:hypothetical protein
VVKKAKLKKTTNSINFRTLHVFLKNKRKDRN